MSFFIRLLLLIPLVLATPREEAVRRRKQCTVPLAQVTTDKGKYPQRGYFEYQVFVDRGGRSKPKPYWRSNRGFKNLTELDPGQGDIFYSLRVFEEMKDQHVLDVGCGGGKLEEDLRTPELIEKFGKIDLIGMDIHLSDEQKLKDYFKEGDVLHTPFKDGEFDSIISTWSVFIYDDISFQTKALKELHRILRPGGRIFLAPGHNALAVANVPGLKVVPRRKGEKNFQFMEIVKE